ncbi:hypothetical protein DXG01_004441 [Tephrocybe rancida]|nr:hypothetical protein DXG01_004441 [Tephrocybe rancida]
MTFNTTASNVTSAAMGPLAAIPSLTAVPDVGAATPTVVLAVILPLSSIPTTGTNPSLSAIPPLSLVPVGAAGQAGLRVPTGFEPTEHATTNLHGGRSTDAPPMAADITQARGIPAGDPAGPTDIPPIMPTIPRALEISASTGRSLQCTTSMSTAISHVKGKDKVTGGSEQMELSDLPPLEGLSSTPVVSAKDVSAYIAVGCTPAPTTESAAQAHARHNANEVATMSVLADILSCIAEYSLASTDQYERLLVMIWGLSETIPMEVNTALASNHPPPLTEDESFKALHAAVLDHHARLELLTSTHLSGAAAPPVPTAYLPPASVLRSGRRPQPQPVAANAQM